MKKILIYNGQLFMGGIERILITFLKELSRRKDIEVELLIKENNPEKNVFEKELPKNIKVTYIKTPQMIEERERYSIRKKESIYYKIMYLLSLKKERSYMRKWLKKYFDEKKDIEVVIDFDMSLGKYLDALGEVKKIGWVHYTLTEKLGKKRKRYAKRLKKYDGIAVICEEMKEEIKEFFSFAYNRTKRIYNPFLIDEIRERANNFENLSEEEKKMLSEDYIVGVSRLTSGKGRSDLIRAFSKLQSKGIEEKLYILGDGPERENLEKLIRDLSLEEKVFMVGQKQNPYPWMKNAKLLAHSSYGEGFANILVEAMICETPCVAYDCKVGPKDVLGEGKFGSLVEVGNIDGFAEELLTLLKSEKELDKYRKKLRERVEVFSAEKSTDDLLKMIKNI